MGAIALGTERRGCIEECCITVEIQGICRSLRTEESGDILVTASVITSGKEEIQAAIKLIEESKSVEAVII